MTTQAVRPETDFDDILEKENYCLLCHSVLHLSFSLQISYGSYNLVLLALLMRKPTGKVLWPHFIQEGSYSWYRCTTIIYSQLMLFSLNKQTLIRVPKTKEIKDRNKFRTSWDINYLIAMYHLNCKIIYMFKNKNYFCFSGCKKEIKLS